MMIIFPNMRNGRPVNTIENILLVMKAESAKHYRGEYGQWEMYFPAFGRFYDASPIARALLKNLLTKYDFISPTVSIGTIKAMRWLVEPQEVQA